MGDVRLTFEQRKLVLKWYWKFENVCEVQRQWRQEFATEPPTRRTISRIRDKFEADGTVQDMHKQRSGRPRTSTSPDASDEVLQRFIRSPGESIRQCARETGISRPSIHRILKRARCIPALLHAVNEDDPDCRIEFCEWIQAGETENAQFANKMVSSEETTFKLNNTVNQDNST